jgi:hypothetical protein
MSRVASLYIGILGLSTTYAEFAIVLVVLSTVGMLRDVFDVVHEGFDSVRVGYKRAETAVLRSLAFLGNKIDTAAAWMAEVYKEPLS